MTLPISSPHVREGRSTQRIMQCVLLATAPGILVLTHFFGYGILVNLLWGSLVALACEALAFRLRGRAPREGWSDCSALVTAWLLCIALPPCSPWWLIAIGVASAILLAKHLYGGLGHNLFNPAMVGYAVLLVSFPAQMSAWPAPRGLAETPGLLEALQACFLPARVDGMSMATPLDILRHNDSLLIDDLWQQHRQFGRWAGIGWEWANLAFLAGGAWLLYLRIFTWHAPVAMLASLSLLAALFHDGGSSASGGSPLFHLLSGSTMLGAFFIVTDPVTSATSARGRLVYGALTGALLYAIRVGGHYPDGMAFAVLIMNFAAPLIDIYTRPRAYGHPGRQHGD